MGLFKKADEIAYLRNEIERLTDENLRLNGENDILRGKLKATQNFVDSTPSDCTPGKWCATCEFSRFFHLPSHSIYSLNKDNVIYVCGKSEVCKNFLQRKVELD